MPSLKEIQSSFAQAIYENDDASILPEIKTNTRLQIYKDNVLLTLHDNLKNKYPIVCELVDERFFKYAASEYIKKYKPISGNLDEYGKDFANFIENFPATEKMAYLADIAKFEWAMHIAYFAADAEKINASALARLTPEQLAELKFALHPSAKIISSNYAIDKIWQMVQNGFKDIDINIHERGADLLIVRPEYKIEVLVLASGEAEFLTSLQNGENLYSTFELASAKNPDFEVGSAIQKFTFNSTFVGFYE